MPYIYIYIHIHIYPLNPNDQIPKMSLFTGSARQAPALHLLRRAQRLAAARVDGGAQRARRRGRRADETTVG